MCWHKLYDDEGGSGRVFEVLWPTSLTAPCGVGIQYLLEARRFLYRCFTMGECSDYRGDGIRICKLWNIGYGWNVVGGSLSYMDTFVS